MAEKTRVPGVNHRLVSIPLIRAGFKLVSGDKHWFQIQLPYDDGPSLIINVYPTVVHEADIDYNGHLLIIK